MKIRLVLIPRAKLAHVRPLVEALRHAVDSEDMNGMDAATEQLAALTPGNNSVDITEAEWRRFVAEIRSRDPAFSSDYLLPWEVCATFFPGTTPETMVLQLPLDEKEGEDV